MENSVGSITHGVSQMSDHNSIHWLMIC